MNEHYINLQARENFQKLHQKSFLNSLVDIIRPNEYNKLLSFYDIRQLLGSKKEETYLGLQVVAISQIIGSEGRYQDFTRSFLPKSKHLQARWISISSAIQQDIILPPIQLFQVGEAYFVRDGNHRVSVARANGVEMIDAEVTEIAANIYLQSSMTHAEILQRVIDYERKMIFKETRLANYIDTSHLILSSAGAYSLIIQHIMGHKYFIEQERKAQQDPNAVAELTQISQINPVLGQFDMAALSFSEAAQSWYESLFQPIFKLIHQEGLLAQFPKRSAADLYIWLVSHWQYLKDLHGNDIPLGDAVLHYSKMMQGSFWQRSCRNLAKFLFKNKFNKGGAPEKTRST